jgi:riboflavin synthase
VFTGLVADMGSVETVEQLDDGLRLVVRTGLENQLSEGDSIAVNGVCLTATALTKDTFSVEVMSETLKRSTIAEVQQGDQVNLELPPRAGDRLGGHIVQGHVDAVGEIRARQEQGIACLVTIAIPDDFTRYVVAQGSIAVNGVSLTVVDVFDDSFSVALIPETLVRTNLGTVAVGSRVNLEVDVFAKYVEKLLNNQKLLNTSDKS